MTHSLAYLLTNLPCHALPARLGAACARAYGRRRSYLVRVRVRARVRVRVRVRVGVGVGVRVKVRVRVGPPSLLR